MNEDYALRPANPSDVEALLALCEATQDGPPVTWRREQLLAHMEAFPDGQLLVEGPGDQVVAAAAGLIVTFGRNLHRDHTWAGITDDGWFSNHDPYGETLYVAYLAVHPDHRGKGIGRHLLQTYRDRCGRENLRRVVVPGRPYGLRSHGGGVSPVEYVTRVADGEISDPVLSFLLAANFSYEALMANYWRDERTGEHAAFMEWINPRYKPKSRKQRSIRVSCVQYRMRPLDDFAGFARQVRFFVDVAAEYEGDYVVFPELVTTQLMSCMDVRTSQEAIRRLTDYTGRVEELFAGLSKEFQLSIVNGSHPVQIGDRIENVSSLYLPDGTVYRQSKLHVTPSEAEWWGISGGNDLQVFHTPKAKVGILICYDIEFPEAARYLADQGAQIILVPFCTDDRQGYLRVRYCAQARAVENQIYVALAGTVGNLPSVQNMGLQYAQSAVLGPSDFLFARDGVLVEASLNTETVITTDIDLGALEEAHNEGSVRPRHDRRRDLFHFEARLGDQAE